MQNRVLAAFSALVLCSAAFASERVAQQTKVTGKIPGGGFSASVGAWLVTGNFYSGIELNSDAIYANVFASRYDGADFVTCAAYGQFPPSSVTADGNRMTVDFGLTAYCRACNTECWAEWSEPVRWSGTFELAKGSALRTTMTTGNTTSTWTYAWGPTAVYTETYRSVGNLTSTAATFAGAFGPFSIEAPAAGSNATWTVQSGQATYTLLLRE